MFIFRKHLEQTGVIRNENYSDPILESGLKTMTSPSFITGNARFVVTKRNTERRKTQDGITNIDTLMVQFPWDEIKDLSASGITLMQGKTKLRFDGDEFRLINLDDFGLGYNRGYMPLGILEARFEKERKDLLD